MQLEKGHKFNRLDSGWFWLSRYSNDRLTREEAITLFMEEFFCIDYSNPNEAIHRAAGMILSCFLEHYKNTHRFSEEMVNMVLYDFNPFRHTMYKEDHLKDSTEYAMAVIDHVFGIFQVTSCQYQNENGEWCPLYEFEMQNSEVTEIVEKKMDEFLEKKRQKALKDKLSCKYGKALALKQRKESLEGDLAYYEKDLAMLEDQKKTLQAILDMKVTSKEDQGNFDDASEAMLTVNYLISNRKGYFDGILKEFKELEKEFTQLGEK